MGASSVMVDVCDYYSVATNSKPAKICVPDYLFNAYSGGILYASEEKGRIISVGIPDEWEQRIADAG